LIDGVEVQYTVQLSAVDLRSLYLIHSVSGFETVYIKRGVL